MTPEDFKTLATILKKRSGLALAEDKTYLLESRLMPVVRRRKLDSIEALVAKLRMGNDPSLETEVMEVMTTNESFFFRDTRPFDQFRDVVLPELMVRRAQKRRIRVWSAACSSGQEPYSLAMLLKEMGSALAGWTVEIVATDISEEILAKARQGVYTQFEVQRGLPIQLLMKYFSQTDQGWKIDPALGASISFRPFNLLDSMAGLGTFDVVYCRNVLIYFDQPTKTQVLERIRKQMADDGYLFLGGAETVLGICDAFKPLAGQRGMYTIQEAGAPRRSAPAGIQVSPQRIAG